MTNQRELDALSAYLTYLTNKGASKSDMEMREKFLNILIPMLDKVTHNGAFYRDIVESLESQQPKLNWAVFLPVAREYFLFWMDDFKAIASLSREISNLAAPTQWVPPECDLQKMWASLDKEKFSMTESWPLKGYSKALKDSGADTAVIEARVNLAKLLLLRLRDAPEVDDKYFRIAVDTTVPLFTMKETKRLFLIVVREYYYFWAGSPNAAKQVFATKAVFI